MNSFSPAKNDVLSGRGGAVNAHSGNVQFREWVEERKHEYNTATSKTQKNRLIEQIVQLVQQQNGRFLQKVNQGEWEELSSTRVLAKVSQALREGAPQIKAAQNSRSKNKTIHRVMLPSKFKFAPNHQGKGKTSKKALEALARLKAKNKEEKERKRFEQEMAEKLKFDFDSELPLLENMEASFDSKAFFEEDGDESVDLLDMGVEFETFENEFGQFPDLGLSWKEEQEEDQWEPIDIYGQQTELEGDSESRAQNQRFQKNFISPVCV